MKDDFKTKKFGRLTYICDAPSRNYRRYCKWKCDCGKEVVVRKSNVLFNEFPSCGCMRKKHDSKLWKGFGEIPSTYWSTILQRKHLCKNRTVNISIGYAWEIFQKQKGKCALTGEPITFSSKYDSIKGTASLDRIDSKLGYEEGNVQWVHKDVNRMKSNLTMERFLTLCKEIVDNSSNMK
jgi:hypothetical protein